MSITLEDIKATQTKLAEMIATFEQGQPINVHLIFPQTDIELQPGEHYAGVILDENGMIAHHLILLPGEAETVTWAKAKVWASEIGGELPTRREQSLLFANLNDQFKPEWYWSGEQHASDSAFAWCQDFYDGGQSYDDSSIKLRARAVRRLPIQ